MAIQGYLLDLDGTVYLGERLIAGADRAVATLRRRGRRVVFLSNKPLNSRADYADKLTRLGIPAGEDDVINSSYVLARYLSQRSPGAMVYAIGEAPLIAELKNAEFMISEDPEKIEYVTAAFDRTFDYHKLNIGFQALRRGAHFIATNPDRPCPVDGGEIPDAAGVIAALEATSGQKVEQIVGKPSHHTVNVAVERLGLPAKLCAMVGDRLETDARMGNNSGLTTILTLTGVTSQAALDRSSTSPDYVIEGIADLPLLDLELNK